MSSSPYRVPAHVGSDSPRALPRSYPDLSAVAGFAWVVTLVRVVAALVRTEAPNRELDLAWLILFLAPVVIWKEIDARRGRR